VTENSSSSSKQDEGSSESEGGEGGSLSREKKLGTGGVCERRTSARSRRQRRIIGTYQKTKNVVEKKTSDEGHLKFFFSDAEEAKAHNEGEGQLEEKNRQKDTRESPLRSEKNPTTRGPEKVFMWTFQGSVRGPSTQPME
jgi:hypothetical protein